MLLFLAHGAESLCRSARLLSKYESTWKYSVEKYGCSGGNVHNSACSVAGVDKWDLNGHKSVGLLFRVRQDAVLVY